MERYGYGEEYIDKLIDYTILKYIWKYRNQTVGKCKCKAISFIDDEITSRKPRNGSLRGTNFLLSRQNKTYLKWTLIQSQFSFLLDISLKY
jgi:hypothetical protein